MNLLPLRPLKQYDGPLTPMDEKAEQVWERFRDPQYYAEHRIDHVLKVGRRSQT